MLRRILMVINPVTLFLVINILSPREMSKYDIYSELNSIDYVNIGSSHARDAFNYDDYPNSINLGFGSQRMYYGLKILEAIEDKLDSQSTIIIPISIFSFCGQFDGPNQRYLGFLSREELGITYEEELLERYLPYLGINKTELLFNRSVNQILEFLDNGNDRAIFHIELTYDCGVIDESILQRTESFIQRNIEKRIIFVITPYFESYWTPILVEGVVVNRVYETVVQIVNEYGLEFYDYSSDSSFRKSNELFRDSDHMNGSGAVEFTKMFINQIESDRDK
jgi:hypothetical protein